MRRRGRRRGTCATITAKYSVDATLQIESSSDSRNLQSPRVSGDTSRSDSPCLLLVEESSWQQGSQGKDAPVERRDAGLDGDGRWDAGRGLGISDGHGVELGGRELLHVVEARVHDLHSQEEQAHLRHLPERQRHASLRLRGQSCAIPLAYATDPATKGLLTAFAGSLTKHGMVVLREQGLKRYLG
jgi:hypothetical protein